MMKKTFNIGFMLIIVLAFCGISGAAEKKNDDGLLAKNTDPFQTQKMIEIKCKTPVKQKDKKTEKEKKKDKINDIVKKKIDDNNWKKPKFCRPLIHFWCNELCSDVSPAIPGGGKAWGKKCEPFLLGKCRACGYLK